MRLLALCLVTILLGAGCIAQDGSDGAGSSSRSATPYDAPRTATLPPPLPADGANAGLPYPGAGPMPRDHTFQPERHFTDGSPYGVHLSFSDDPKTTLTVTWFTWGSGDVSPTLEWGMAPDALVNVLDAMTEKAYIGEGEAETLSDAYTHAATMTGLSAGQWVYYRVNGTTGASAIYDGHTNPGPGAKVTIGLWGDKGVTNESMNTTILALAARPDLILHAGDLSYANGAQVIWDEYFWVHEPLFARVPVMASIGNHETNDGSYFDGFRTRHTFPGNELWFGFDYGDLHVTVIEADGETLFDPVEEHLAGGNIPAAVSGLQAGAELVRFIEEDLADTDARRQAGETVWSSALFHFPLYSNHNTRGNACELIAILEPTFHAWGVDLLLTGHNHHYERSTPMAFGAEDDNGFVQLINGGAGKSLYDFLPDDRFAAWGASHYRGYGITLLEIQGDSLRGRHVVSDQAWMQNQSLPFDVVDEFTVTYGTDRPQALDPSTVAGCGV